MEEKKAPVGTAIIIGASRGLGLGLVREYLQRNWQILATYRDQAGQDALAALGLTQPGRLTAARIDMKSAEDTAKLQSSLVGSQVDLVFINGGISGDTSRNVEDVEIGEFFRVMETNALAPLRLAAAFRPLIRNGGTIAVMSSNMGSVSGNRGSGWEVYRASKAALNQLMKSYAYRNAGDGRTYLLVSPGWVKTDMGGDGAPLDVETSARGIVDTITTYHGSGGVHFVDYQGNIVDW